MTIKWLKKNFKTCCIKVAIQNLLWLEMRMRSRPWMKNKSILSVFSWIVNHSFQMKIWLIITAFNLEPFNLEKDKISGVCFSYRKWVLCIYNIEGAKLWRMVATNEIIKNDLQYSAPNPKDWIYFQWQYVFAKSQFTSLKMFLKYNHWNVKGFFPELAGYKLYGLSLMHSKLKYTPTGNNYS